MSRPPGPWPEGFAARLATTPRAVALDDGTTTRTWADLADRAVAHGWALRERGLGPGDRLAVVAGNGVATVEVVLASLVHGFWVTMVNHHLVAPEVRHVVVDSGARIVLADAAHVEVARSAAADGDLAVEVLDGAPWERAVDAAGATPVAGDGPPGGTMFYTSGTTGFPKGVQRRLQPTVAEQLAQLVANGRALGLHGTGPHLVTGPLHHAAPAGFAIMDLLAGAPVHLLPRFDAAATLAAIDRIGVHTTHVVPTMMVRLLRLDEAVRRSFGGASLATVLHGAAPVAPHTKAAMIDWWGPVLVEYWGSSESGVATLATSEQWLERPGTVGRALPHLEVWAGDEAGRPLAPDEVGTLWIRRRDGQRVFAYHHDEAKTEAAHEPGGGFTIGDLGRVDADGYVYLADRAGHFVITGGVNVYPAEVEAALARHPAVADVAVFGVPDDEWGERVHAAVEPGDDHRHVLTDPDAGEALRAELVAHARDLLAPYKVPRSVAWHDRLPRADTGKIAVRELRSPHWAGRDRQI